MSTYYVLRPFYTLYYFLHYTVSYPKMSIPFSLSDIWENWTSKRSRDLPYITSWRVSQNLLIHLGLQGTGSFPCATVELTTFCHILCRGPFASPAGGKYLGSFIRWTDLASDRKWPALWPNSQAPWITFNVCELLLSLQGWTVFNTGPLSTLTSPPSESPWPGPASWTVTCLASHSPMFQRAPFSEGPHGRNYAFPSPS